MKRAGMMVVALISATCILSAGILYGQGVKCKLVESPHVDTYIESECIIESTYVTVPRCQYRAWSKTINAIVEQAAREEVEYEDGGSDGKDVASFQKVCPASS